MSRDSGELVIERVLIKFNFLVLELVNDPRVPVRDDRPRLVDSSDELGTSTSAGQNTT